MDDDEIEEHVHLNYLDPSYGKLSASYDVIDWDHTNGKKALNSTPIAHAACPIYKPKFKAYQGFKITEQEALENNEFDNYFCLDPYKLSYIDIKGS